MIMAKPMDIMPVKIKLRDRQTLAYPSKILYFCHHNWFCDSSYLCFPTAIGGIFYLHIKDTKFLSHYQSIRYKAFSYWRHSPHNPVPRTAKPEITLLILTLYLLRLADSRHYSRSENRIICHHCFSYLWWACRARPLVACSKGLKNHPPLRKVPRFTRHITPNPTQRGRPPGRAPTLTILFALLICS